MHVLGKRILISAIGLFPATVMGADPPRFVISEDGTAIIDRHAKLAWARCAAGMTWRGGTCSGDTESVAYQEASSLAKSQASRDGVPWRLPTLTELRTLAERLRSMEAQADMLFPQAPAGWYWTSSVRVETGRVNQYDYANAQRGLTDGNVNRVGYLHGWVVDIDAVRVRSEMPRRNKAAVRFVRTLKE